MSVQVCACSVVAQRDMCAAFLAMCISSLAAQHCLQPTPLRGLVSRHDLVM